MTLIKWIEWAEEERGREGGLRAARARVVEERTGSGLHEWREGGEGPPPSSLLLLLLLLILGAKSGSNQQRGKKPFRADVFAKTILATCRVSRPRGNIRSSRSTFLVAYAYPWKTSLEQRRAARSEEELIQALCLFQSVSHRHPSSDRQFSTSRQRNSCWLSTVLDDVSAAESDNSVGTTKLYCVFIQPAD